MDFEIVRMQRSMPDEMVMEVQFIVTKMRDDHYVSIPLQAIELPKKLKDDPTFIEFQNLTKQNVIDWIGEQLGSDKLQDLENQLDAKLDEAINPTVVVGLPW